MPVALPRIGAHACCSSTVEVSLLAGAVHVLSCTNLLACLPRRHTRRSSSGGRACAGDYQHGAMQAGAHDCDYNKQFDEKRCRLLLNVANISACGGAVALHYDWGNPPREAVCDADQGNLVLWSIGALRALQQGYERPAAAAESQGVAITWSFETRNGAADRGLLCMLATLNLQPGCCMRVDQRLGDRADGCLEGFVSCPGAPMA